MAATRITDLLPIPPGIAKPHAYQVFGLEGGEQDPEKLKQAMRAVYERLKTAKPECDPTLWSQAAKIAEAARKVLEDPEKRKELDARFGVVSVSQPSEPSDPLAGMLPSSDPLMQAPKDSTSSPTANENAAAASAGAVLGIPPLGAQSQSGSGSTNPPATPSVPGQLGPPIRAPGDPVVANAPSSNAANTNDQAPPAVGWEPAKPSKKRRKKKSGLFLFVLFVLAMLGSIGGLLYFLSENGKVVINAPEDPDGKIISDPGRPADPPSLPAKPPSDGVLGDIGSSGIADAPSKPSGLSEANPLDENPLAGNGQQMVASDDSMGSPGESQMPNENMSAPAPPSTEPDEATRQQIQSRIAAVEQLIRQGNWDQMKPAADALESLPLKGDQISKARTLYDIADLATFYRGAIQEGLASLNVGATFEVQDGFSVVVVESSQQALTIRFDRKEKSYTIDTLPERLMERVAAIKLERERPDAIAGRSLYRLIHPTTIESYRALAWEDLAAVDGQLKNVDSGKLVEVAKSILQK